MDNIATKSFGTERKFSESRSRSIHDLYMEARPFLQDRGVAVMIYHRRRMELEIHLFLSDRVQTYSLRDITPPEFEALDPSFDLDDNLVFKNLCKTVGYRPSKMKAYNFNAATHISVTLFLYGKENLNELSELVEENLGNYTLRLQNAILLDALDRSRLELELLQETGAILSMSFKLEDVFRSINAALDKLISYNAMGVFILGEHGEAVEEIFSIGYSGEGSRHLLEMKLGKGLVGWAAKTGESVIVPNVHEDPRYFAGRPETKSELVVPLFSVKEVIGAFNLESDRLDAYSPSDLEIVTAFANQAALSVTRARLYRETVEKNKIQDQLQVAREIQKSFLPNKAPKYAGFDFDAVNISSEEVGGDYFDFIPIVDHQLGVTIADVSGKGLPASLIMASYRASLIAEIRNNYAIRTIMRKVNNLICESVEHGNFVTAVYGVLDTKNKIFTFTNAGHFPPFILRASNAVEFLGDGGLTLGIIPEKQYEERPVQINSGDIVVMYTDGITDAENEKAELFGTDRLVEMVKANRELSAEQIRTRVIDEVFKFKSEESQPDDLTLIIIKADYR